MSFFRKIIRRAKHFVAHPSRMVTKLMMRYCPHLVSDRRYIKFSWEQTMDYPLNLDNPQTFCEKLQWLKLHNHNPLLTTLVDKIKVKEWVANRIGEQFIIPTLAIYRSVDEIDIDKLPDQFVLKCNHDSGSTIICRNKLLFDFGKAKEKLEKALSINYYYQHREWPYKNVPRRILAEEFIESISPTKDLIDYKIFCFNGEPQFCQVISNRETQMSIDFFDKEWNHQPFHEPRFYPFATLPPERPDHLECMWDAARKLAVDKPFVRIDFYDVNGHVYFGEITFYPTRGMGGFSPESYDTLFGQMIQLPRNGV